MGIPVAVDAGAVKLDEDWKMIEGSSHIEVAVLDPVGVIIVG